MPRRHQQKGCDCMTCTNERLYKERVREARRSYWIAQYRSLDDAALAKRLADGRRRRRAAAEARDHARLAALRGDEHV